MSVPARIHEPASREEVPEPLSTGMVIATFTAVIVPFLGVVAAVVLLWGRGFDRYLQTGNQQIPCELVLEARRLHLELSASQRTTMLLHGDLQHYNVLLDDERGWLAIDPKGVVGELEYELGALLRNPVEQPELFANPATVNRRLVTLTTLLHLDHTRALHWSFAQAVLSAIWDVEDGYNLEPNNPSLLLAQVLVKVK